jgi:signal transduction histidine kinase
LEIIREDGPQRFVNRQACNAEELIDRVLSTLQSSFELGGIRIERVRNADLVLELDADVIGIVLTNLLGNIEKYAASGRVAKIETRVNGTQLIILVSDEGPGIPWRYRESVFQPFRRLDNQITAPSGTGIGLTIARRAAQRHGGNVRLLPSPKGSLFEVTIAGTASDAA